MSRASEKRLFKNEFDFGNVILSELDWFDSSSPGTGWHLYCDLEFVDRLELVGPEWYFEDEITTALERAGTSIERGVKRERFEKRYFQGESRLAGKASRALESAAEDNTRLGP